MNEQSCVGVSLEVKSILQVHLHFDDFCNHSGLPLHFLPLLALKVSRCYNVLREAAFADYESYIQAAFCSKYLLLICSLVFV